MLFSTSALFLLAAPALGQTINSWGQPVFTGCCGSADHYVDQAVDGNPDTYYENFGLPAQLAILLNNDRAYTGFYIQSSGSYITDYYVKAVSSDLESFYIIGGVSNATSNFTVVNFYNAEGEPQMTTDTIFVYITGTLDNNSTAIVNEIYPIFPGDTIVYPPGQSASPSPTQTTLTSTSQPAPPTSTQTTTTAPTPTATVSGLDSWPTSGAYKPIPIGGSNSAALVDGDPSTGSSEPLVTNLGYPGVYDLLFNGVTTYSGLYILSESPNYLTDYHVLAQNTTTYETFEVCRITGATSNFTVCPFINEAGAPEYNTGIIQIYPDAVYGGGSTAVINEIYPIYPGDVIVDV